MVYNIARRPGIQIAGMSGRWKRAPGGRIEFVSIDVEGKPLDEHRTYACAASDYFVGEAKRYLGEEILRPVFLRPTVFDAIERVVRRRKEIVPGVTDTIEEVR